MPVDIGGTAYITDSAVLTITSQVGLFHMDDVPDGTTDTGSSTEYYHVPTVKDNNDGVGTGGRDYADHPTSYVGLFFNTGLRKGGISSSGAYEIGNSVDGSALIIMIITITHMIVL